MKDILLYLYQQNFARLIVEIAVGGFVLGFGSSLTLSMIGYSAYKTFNLIERSSR